MNAGPRRANFFVVVDPPLYRLFSTRRRVDASDRACFTDHGCVTRVKIPRNHLCCGRTTSVYDFGPHVDTAKSYLQKSHAISGLRRIDERIPFVVVRRAIATRFSRTNCQNCPERKNERVCPTGTPDLYDQRILTPNPPDITAAYLWQSSGSMVTCISIQIGTHEDE